MVDCKIANLFLLRECSTRFKGSTTRKFVFSAPSVSCPDILNKNFAWLRAKRTALARPRIQAAPAGSAIDAWITVSGEFGASVDFGWIAAGKVVSQEAVEVTELRVVIRYSLQLLTVFRKADRYTAPAESPAREPNRYDNG